MMRALRAVRAILHILQETGRAARVCADLPSFVRLSTDLVRYRTWPARDRPFDNSERRVRFRGGVTITYRLNKGDIWSVREVWLYDVYRLPFDISPRVLVDLGGNIGLTSVWLSKRYGCERVLVVEPAAANAALARRNLADNAIPAELIEAAVGAEDGVGHFHDDDRSNQGSLGDSGREIPVLSMASVLGHLPAEIMVDLVKVDIEGGEQELLMAPDLSWLRRVRALIFEFHPTLVDYPRLIAQVEKAGFRYYRANTVFPENMDSFLRIQEEPSPVST